MNAWNRCFVVALTIGWSVGALAVDAPPAAEPLDGAHAHNDYWHKRPLLDALDRGFGSVEVDVFLVGTDLLVGHERAELSAERGLESLYLAPLAQRVQENGGRVFPNGHRFFLLIDIKTDAVATYRRLEGLLEKYAEMCTTVDDGKFRKGAVTIVLSGNRPIETLLRSKTRHAAFDGRLGDLERDVPVHLMPMISDAWPAHFVWQGNGPMPDAERAKLREIARKAHESGRILRFWATPENETVWRELRDAGVDLIGTDQLDRLANFLRASEKSGSSADR